jgi:hypothetical protein
LLVGDKDAGEPKKSNSDARKKSKFEEEAEENATEPFGGKHKPNQKTIPKRCNAKGGGDNPRSVVRERTEVKHGKETHQGRERRDPWRTGIGR